MTDTKFNNRKFMTVDEDGVEFEISGKELIKTKFVFYGIKINKFDIDEIKKLTHTNSHHFNFLGVHPGDFHHITITRVK